MIATTRVSEKKDFLFNQGADFVIATEEEDFVSKIAEITEHKGFDIAFDAIAGSFLNLLAEAAAKEASIVVYGALSMEETPYPLFLGTQKGLDISSLHVQVNLLRHLEKFEEAKKDIVTGFEEGYYKAVIDKVFPFDNFKDAYQYLEQASLEGKVLIENHS